MHAIKKKLGEMLIEAGVIDDLQLRSALGHQKQWGGRLASTLINLNLVNERSIASILEKKLGQKCISLEDIQIQPEALKKINYDIARKQSILPLDFDKKTLTIAMSDPTDLKIIDELSFRFGVRIKPVLAIESSINKALDKYYKDTSSRGKSYTVDFKNLPDKMELTRNEFPESEHKPKELSYTSDMLIESLSELLVEKKLIKKEELTDKLTKKLQRNQRWNIT